MLAGVAPREMVKSDLIVIWGNNVTVSNLHFAQVIQSARKKAAKEAKKKAAAEAARKKAEEKAKADAEASEGTPDIQEDAE